MSQTAQPPAIGTYSKKVKVKVKFTLGQATKAQSRGIALLFFEPQC